MTTSPTTSPTTSQTPTGTAEPATTEPPASRARLPRPKRSRADKPAPDWDLVYKRNYIERLKRDRPPMDVRSELPELTKRGYEDVPEEDLVRLYWWGLAHDKPKIGTFMVRVKVAGGLVNSTQLRALATIAAEYGRDEAELTTRQGIQLHWVEMGKLESVMRELEAVGLTTGGAEGDTVRNITGCPVAGLHPEEPFDVTPVLREVADHFYGNLDYSNLPRKHKYTISGCPSQCNAPEISDVALIATLKDGRPGFGLRIGGGMANTPRIAQDLQVFIPAEEAVESLAAVTQAWATDLRYRISRARARIKFMMDDYGVDGVRAKVEEQLGRPLEPGAVVEPTEDADHIGVHPQKQKGLVYVGVPVPSGKVTGTMLGKLAAFIEEFDGDVRFTRQQNFILANVPEDRVPDVKALLDELGLSLSRSRAVARSIACTSHRFCNYSVAETKGKLDEILDDLTTRFGPDRIGDLAIHMDGCPHACAQHWVGEIGLQGTTTRVEGSDERVEAYDLTVAGGLGTRTAIGRRLIRRVPTDDIVEVLANLVGAWITERDSGHAPTWTFGDFCSVHEDDELIAIGLGAATGQDQDEHAGKVVVSIPGPLLEFVKGTDEFTLEAGTVGEALDQIARQHPEFGTTVFDHGKVNGAFLVAVGDDDIRGLDGLATKVGPGAEITLVMAMSGG